MNTFCSVKCSRGPHRRNLSGTANPITADPARSRLWAGTGDRDTAIQYSGEVVGRAHVHVRAQRRVPKLHEAVMTAASAEIIEAVMTADECRNYMRQRIARLLLRRI